MSQAQSPNPDSPHEFARPAIELRDVSLTIGGHPIIEQVNWSVRAGACAAILGPNGGGKSTLLRMLTGYLYPTRGSIDLLRCRIGRTNLDDLRRRIGLVNPSGPFQPDHRQCVIDVVLSGFFGHLCVDFDVPTPEQERAARHALVQVGLAERPEQLFHTLSTGQQRRALLARAMVHRPELLLLDEPTAGLDLLARETLLATIDMLIREAPEMTVLVVTHHVEELSPRTDTVLLLVGGRSFAHGPPAAVLTSATVSAAFGCPVQVDQEHGRWTWKVTPTVWDALVTNPDHQK